MECTACSLYGGLYFVLITNRDTRVSWTHCTLIVHKLDWKCVPVFRHNTIKGCSTDLG